MRAQHCHGSCISSLALWQHAALYHSPDALDPGILDTAPPLPPPPPLPRSLFAPPAPPPPPPAPPGVPYGGAPLLHVATGTGVETFHLPRFPGGKPPPTWMPLTEAWCNPDPRLSSKSGADSGGGVCFEAPRAFATAAGQLTNLLAPAFGLRAQPGGHALGKELPLFGPRAGMHTEE